MIIVAAGDSFVFGAELQDQKHGPSMSTYPALLAQDAGFEYLCIAQSGNSNASISRQTINACEKYKDKNLFVFITWSFSCRYEFHFNNKVLKGANNWYSITPWDSHESIDSIIDIVKSDTTIVNHHIKHYNTLTSIGLTNFAKEFFKHVGNNELYEIYSTLKEIVYLQQYLKINKIPYLFTCVDTAFFNQNTYNNIDIRNLKSLIDMDNWFLFEPAIEGWNTTHSRGFYQWAVENKYPVGTTHPLEEAHTDAAKLMKEKFNELVKKSVQ